MFTCVQRPSASYVQRTPPAFTAGGGTARLLLEGAGGAHAEARRRPEPRLAAHRQRSFRAVHEVEPEEQAVAARRVDLAALERLPDAVPVAAGGVHGDEAARHEER